MGCWAHARRKFFDLHQANASTVAYEVLQRIGGLYAAGAEAKHLSTEARQILRAQEKPADPAIVARLVTANPRPNAANGGGTAKPSITP
ncbi:MAG: transposase, partial [Nitrosomonas sp.]|nr:transposase [Nitrosomonas sp.]